MTPQAPSSTGHAAATPAWQFYPAEFVADVAECSAEETGIYVLLLAREWQRVGLELDPKRLAVVCKVTPAAFREAWATLQAYFVEREGRWFSVRNDRERAKQSARRIAAQVGAAKTNGKRWPKRGPSDPGTSDSESLSDGGASLGDGSGSLAGRSSSSSSPTATAVGARARGNGHGNGHGTRHGAGQRRGMATAGELIGEMRPHLPAVAVAPPWCAECGPGDLQEVPGQRRPVRLHASSCSRYVAPAAPPTEVPA